MITDTAIKNAIAKGRNRELKDGTGKGTGRLILRIRNTGKRVVAEWFARQWIDGKRRTIKLGTYPTLPLADARKLFSEKFAPAIESRSDIRRQKTDHDKPGTLSDLFDGYVAYLKNDGAASVDDTRYCLNVALKELDGTRPASAIETDDIVALLRKIYARGPTFATKLRAMISAAYGWALRLENDYRIEATNKVFHLKGNPVSATPTDPARSGERWLNADELRAYWQWLNGPATERRGKSARYIEPHNVAALKLHALLGQRAVEIVRIRAAFYNADRHLIEWPKDATKTGKRTQRGHVLPVPPQAAAILDEMKPNEHGLFFPSSDYPNLVMNSDTLGSIVHRYVTENDVTAFCLRDIRRTWKTLTGVAKISKVERDLLQNHSKKGDTSSKHYDRYDYLDEKRAAMERWGRWFAENIENEPAPKVINLR
jgi:hypothetical protein